MLPSKDTETTNIPPKIKLLYTDFKLVSQAHYFKIFSALSKANSQPFTIRALDFYSDFYKSNPNLAATIFIQELLRLSTLHPSTIIIEDFEINDKAIAFVTTSYIPLNFVVKEEKGRQQIDIENLIKDVMTDLSFLVSQLKLNSTSNIHIGWDNIYQMSDSKGYILGDWVKGLGNENAQEKSVEVSQSVSDSNGEKEMQSFAVKILELCGAKNEDLEDLMAIRNPTMHMLSLDYVLGGLNLLKDSTKKTLKSMVTKEADARMKLAHFAKRSGNVKQTPQKVGKVSRFEKDMGEKNVWNYNSDSNVDAVSFKTSSNIRVTGVGLFIPMKVGLLKGTVKLVEGANVDGAILASKEVELTKDMPGALNNIYPLMLENNPDILAEKTYTIVSVMEKGSCSYYGSEAKEELTTNEGIKFAFFNCAGSTNSTGSKKGQFPEIYYAY